MESRTAGRRLVIAGILSACLLAAPSSRAATIIDTMNNTSGFFSFTVVQFVGPAPGDVVVDPPGYLLPTATANGDGTVTLAVQDGHSDTSDEIVDWTMPGASNPYMDLTADRFLQLNLTGVFGTENYDVFLLFWGSGTTPTFLSETEWLDMPGSTDLNPTLDVSTLAPVGAAQYFVRFRLFPTDLPGNVLTLDSIETSDAPLGSAPEPAVGFVVGFAILAGSFCQSRRGRRNPTY
jgi:hypothetical protein